MRRPTPPSLHPELEAKRQALIRGIKERPFIMVSDCAGWRETYFEQRADEAYAKHKEQAA